MIKKKEEEEKEKFIKNFMSFECEKALHIKFI
jgi:hypothetical protein